MEKCDWSAFYFGECVTGMVNQVLISAGTQSSAKKGLHGFVTG